MTLARKHLIRAWWLLRVGLGLGILVAGLDKFAGVLTDWSMYLSPAIERLLPFGGPAFLRAAGVVEVLIGLAILTRWPRRGAYLLSAWLAVVAFNLAVSGHFWDLVLRDVEIALSAFTLGRLTAWQESVSTSLASAPAKPAAAHAGGGVY